MLQEQKKNNKNGITEGVIWKELLLFFFPILFGTFFQQLYNTADAMVVGRFVGKEALSAVGGSTGTLINLLVGFFVGLSSGATVIIAQKYGAKRDEETSQAVHTSMALAIAGGAVMMVIGLITAKPALLLTNTPKEIMPHAMTYMCIYYCGLIFNMIYNIGSGILRALGDSKRPLYFLITCCITNILLDLVFVIGLKMGVAGVGIATVISQFISAMLVLYVLMHSHEVFHLELRKIRFHANILRPLIQIGIPAGLQSVMYSLSNIVVQARFNLFGTDVVASWTAYGKLDALFWMIVQAFGIAVTTFVSQNLGAGKLDRVYKSISTTIKQCLAATLLLSGIMCLGGRQLYTLFTTDSTVIHIGYRILIHLAPLYFLYIPVEVLAGAMRGAGDSLIPMLITCGGVCVMRILWIVLAVPLRPTYLMVCFCYPLTWGLTGLLFILYYRRKTWLHNFSHLLQIQETKKQQADS